MKPSNEQLGLFFKTYNSRFDRCLEPRMACKNPAIRAHSIQNARVLDLLVAKGHVVTFRPVMTDRVFDLEFKLIGRDLASTFTGLCSEHDADIFRPIDTNPFDRNNQQHLFLLAYRSVCRELHAIMEAAGKYQSYYQSAVEAGLERADPLSEVGKAATARLLIAYQTYMYRADNFDLPLLAQEYGSVKHDVIEISHAAPVLAVSSLFSLDELSRGIEAAKAVLNVFPLNAKTSLVVFSYTPGDQNKVRSAIDRVRSSTGEYQKYELSRLIVGRIENFVIAPVHFDTWSEEKRAQIKKAFIGTSMNNEPVPDHQDMMLF